MKTLKKLLLTILIFSLTSIKAMNNGDADLARVLSESKHQAEQDELKRAIALSQQTHARQQEQKQYNQAQEQKALAQAMAESELAYKQLQERPAAEENNKKDADQKTVDNELEKALERRDWYAIFDCLDRGANINFADAAGDTLLIIACLSGSSFENIASNLIDRGAAIDAQNKEGKTALMASIRASNYALVQKLLIAKANVNIPDIYKKNALFYACQVTAKAYAFENDDNDDSDDYGSEFTQKNREIVKKLIEFGADINAQDNSGCSLLMDVIDENPELFAMILEKNPDLTLKENRGKTIFDAVEKQAIYRPSENLEMNIQLLKQHVEKIAKDTTSKAYLIVHPLMNQITTQQARPIVNIVMDYYHTPGHPVLDRIELPLNKAPDSDSDAEGYNLPCVIQ